MRIPSPCHGCTDRHEGCHGVCLYYKAYRERLDAEAARKRAVKQADYLLSHIQDRRREREKRKNLKK